MLEHHLPSAPIVQSSMGSNGAHTAAEDFGKFLEERRLLFLGDSSSVSLSRLRRCLHRVLQPARSGLEVLVALLKLSNGGSFGSVPKVLVRLSLACERRVRCMYNFTRSPRTVAGRMTLNVSRCAGLGQVGVEAIMGNLRLRPVDLTLRRVWDLLKVSRRWVRLHRLPTLAVVELHPIVDAIFLLARILESLSKELAEVVVVWLVFESEVSDVAEVLVEFFCRICQSWSRKRTGLLAWESLAQILNGSGLLLLANLLVLLLVGGSLESLPGQASAQKVHENMAQRLQVVSSRLLSSQVGVDAHVSRGSRQRLALAIGNVLFGLWVSVLLRHAEINYMDDVGHLRSRPANQEVVRLDIAVDEVTLVDGLHSGQLQWGLVVFPSEA
jgi:hypothetical protein